MGQVEKWNPIPLPKELKRGKEEKSPTLEELDELRESNMASKTIACECKLKSEALEKELHRSKESERATLEILVAQTELFAKTKISLEETKYKNRALLESSRSLLNPKCTKKKFSSSNGHSLDLVHAQGEIKVLKRDLKLAKEADENSEVAMRGLALTLKEITAESTMLKQKLAEAQSQIEQMRAEAESFKSWLKDTEEKFQAASEECKKTRSELEESAADWNEKEKGFISCIKTYEEEISWAKAENDSLFASRRAAREETVRLREMVKQAVKEAGAAKESMEVARKESARLKDLVSEKGHELARLDQENEWLKVSEAAATESVERLKSLFDATSTVKSSDASVEDLIMISGGMGRNGLGHKVVAQLDGTARPAAKKRLMKEKRQLAERIRIVQRKIFLSC